MRNKHEEQPQYLQLSNRTLRFGSRIYQLRNITNVSTIKIRPTYIVSLKGFVVSGILFFVLMAFETTYTRVAGLIALLVFAGGIIERVKKKPDYALHLETSAGSQKLISSPDKAFIEEMVSKIYGFMDDDSLEAKYVFNLEDKSIRIEGDAHNSVLATGNQNSFS